MYKKIRFDWAKAGLRRRIFLGVLVALVAMLAAGCSLLEGPQNPVIPTPPPTSRPIPLEALTEGEYVLDPVSDVAPGIDPECVTLVNALSQQQLMSYVQTLEGFGTRSTFSVIDRDDRGIGATRRWIFNEFERVGGGRLQVEFQDYGLNFEGRSNVQRNVIATLPGTSDHAGVVVLMANYDTRAIDWLDGSSHSPGADDNGSGVAALLEIARLLSSRSWNQTVVFAALTAEEQGTFGSRHFVEDALFDGLTIDAAINNDMIGGRAGIPQSVRMYAAGPDTANSRQLARYIEYIGGLYLPTFPINTINALDREDRWGDHREFIQAGIAAVRLIESQEDLSIQNSVRDTWDLIDYAYFSKVVQLNLATLCNVIGAPPPPPVPVIVEMADPGSYLLNWPVAPEAAGYAISFRPLGSDEYPPFRFVGGDEAGNVVLTGYDPNITYMVSLAALDGRGRIGYFSPEVLIGPEKTAAAQ